MAIIYLGQNDQAKKVNNFYIGVDNQSKQVVKGYIGIKGSSKLFYNLKYIPTLLSSELLSKQITCFIFYVREALLDPSYDSVDEKKQREILASGGYFYTNHGKIYLGKNCSKLFNNYFFTSLGSPRLYNWEGGVSKEEKFNLEKYFLFNKVEDLSFFFNNNIATTNLYNVTGNLANCNFIKVQNMSYSFYGCTGLTESPQCGPNVIDMSYAYFRCNNLTGSPKSGPNVINMHNTYYDCNNITGSPVCGDKVENMVCTYYGCNNLIGSPVCGLNVTDMHYTYTNCRNLTGSPACGPNVINMRFAYYECTNITGDPACGPNVYRFDSCYGGCRYLGKNVNIGEKVTSAVSAYMRAGTWNEGLYLNNIIVGKYSAIDLSNCFRECNIDGDMYILNSMSNITYIFNSRSQSTKMVNIHYPITESITQLNTKLSSVKITSSSETHKIIDGSYIDIRTSGGTPYNIRIYADYVES